MEPLTCDFIWPRTEIEPICQMSFILVCSKIQALNTFNITMFSIETCCISSIRNGSREKEQRMKEVISVSITHLF